MKVAGFHCGHDCSYAILEDGVPVVHAELERYLRVKEPAGDAIQFMIDTYPEYKDIKHASYWTETSPKWRVDKKYPKSHQTVLDLVDKNDGKLFYVGHHQSHAANAFFSSNFNDALIVTIDGGGTDMLPDGAVSSAFTVWEGKDIDINLLDLAPDDRINIGAMWSHCTERIFGLSRGYPKGNQCGSVMAMACMGDYRKYFKEFYDYRFSHLDSKPFDFNKFKKIAQSSEQGAFDVAAALQKATEVIVKQMLDLFVDRTESRNLCLAGGVVLNSVMTGKILTEWYGDRFDNVYVCPVPYDAGLSIGSAQYVWHSVLRNPRIQWQDNFTPYLGFTYNREQVLESLDKSENVEFTTTKLDNVINLLSEGNIISVFSGGSESGRRALGNRSILADPRNPDMKNIINEKVKHRQWYRPFAPSILREKVADWFEIDHQSPYMSFVLPFKKEKRKEVPAVVHFDGSARLQTVTKSGNQWYYNFLKEWENKTNVPIILNTSFNDREPIVETPEHAINCFLKTNIDYLYFADCELLVKKKEKNEKH